MLSEFRKAHTRELNPRKRLVNVESQLVGQRLKLRPSLVSDRGGSQSQETSPYPVVPEAISGSQCYPWTVGTAAGVHWRTNWSLGEKHPDT